MRFEQVSNQKKNPEAEILGFFGGETALRNKIEETVHNNKEVELYTPEFAKLISKKYALPEEISWVDLMRIIQKVYPPLKEDYDYNRHPIKKEKTFSSHQKSIVKPWMIKSSFRKALNDERRSGNIQEDDRNQ